MATYRKERVGDLLLGFLAQEIREIGDERLTLLTLTSIEMSPDLKYATVYWMMPIRSHISPDVSAPDKFDFPTDEETKQIEALLGEYKKALRRRVGEELNLRYTPDLRFKYDYSEERGYRIDQLLGKA